MDIETKIVAKVTDEQAQMIIEEYSKCKNAAEFQNLSPALKERFVRKFHSQGVSIRQIARLCGVNKGMVEKWLK